MKPLEVRKYLLDITAAIALLKSFTAGKSLADYKADALLRAGVERQFEIIGEALAQAARRDAAITAYRALIWALNAPDLGSRFLTA